MTQQPVKRRRWLRYFFVFLLLVALLPSVVGLTRALWLCRVWGNVDEIESAIPDETMRSLTSQIEEYARPESQTYLTIPEWYIVYSADEYGAFIQNHSSSDFPYFKAVGQYWQSYYEVCEQVRGRYPYNGNAQFVLGFIGVSFTAENMLKGLYEFTIGRVFDWFAAEPTEEEQFAADVAVEFGAFLHNTPWYLFPFDEKIKELWTETSLWGPGVLRKWERKIALTVEYGVKALYGGLTSAGSQATYGGPDESKIYAVTQNATSEMTNDDFEIVNEINDKQLVYVTRFEVFSTMIPVLMKDGLSFVEIAGNDEIAVTTLGNQDANYDFEYGEYLFDLPILTQAGETRAIIKVKVSELHLFLEELENKTDIRFEHMYDY
ncbi:MAG TPA: hypothetical protein DIW23_10390 [Anaerolineae bacterium]|nr:hypothetical protein [Anaerolineae bacterium]